MRPLCGLLLLAIPYLAIGLCAWFVADTLEALHSLRNSVRPDTVWNRDAGLVRGRK